MPAAGSAGGQSSARGHHAAAAEKEPSHREEAPESHGRHDGSRDVRSPSRKPGPKGKGKGKDKGKGLPAREAGGKGDQVKGRPKKFSPSFFFQQRQERKAKEASAGGHG